MGMHQIAGIGDGFIPELLDIRQLDWTEVIKGQEAVEMAEQVCRKWGMMVGVSTGANVLSAINVLKKIGKDKTVVTILPDRSERYFSTDLYRNRDDQSIIRNCRMGCESPFCDFH